MCRASAFFTQLTRLILSLPDALLALRICVCYRNVSRPPGRCEPTNELISSPNTYWCPLISSFAGPVHLRGDGTFGEDDPTCWPQYYDPISPYLPCIPFDDPDPTSAIHIFRRGLSREHVKLPTVVGRLSDYKTELVKISVLELVAEARDFLSNVDEEHPRLQALVRVLKLAVDKLVREWNILAELRVLFGLTGRLCLEMKGYLNYHTKFLPIPRTTRVPPVCENVVGVLVRDKYVCADYARMGIPVWYVRDGSLVPNLPSSHFVKPMAYRNRPLPEEGCFRDGACFRRFPPLLPSRPDKTFGLLYAIYCWMEDRLKDEDQ